VVGGKSERGHYDAKAASGGGARHHASSAEALGRFLNLGQHPTQHFAIEFAHTIDNLLTTHPDIAITIQHSKCDLALVGFKHAPTSS